jgi:hypothetical protein
MRQIRLEENMKRIFVILIISVILSPFISAQKLYADEYYNFFQITSAPEIHYFHMSRIGIYNKGYFIWPFVSKKNEWKKHVENLKILEKKYGLYVLDGAYGYYDNKEMNYTINTSSKTDIKIEFDKLVRPPGPVGNKQPYKSNPRLKILFDGKKVAFFHLNHIDYQDYYVDEVSVSGDDTFGNVDIEVCIAWFDKNYRRKCTEMELLELSRKSFIFDDAAIIAAINKI